MGENFDGTTKEAPRPLTVYDYEQLLASLYHELSEERACADELKQDAENWFNSYKLASNEVDVLRNEIDELRVELSDKRERAVVLNAQVKELESERIELQATVGAVKNDQAIAQQKADGLLFELEAVRRRRKIMMLLLFLGGLIIGLSVSYYRL